MIMSHAREEAAVAREALVREKKTKKQTTLLTTLPNEAAPPLLHFESYYTCIDYWMQVGLFQDLLHLHELVDANVAFISERRVCARQRLFTCASLVPGRSLHLFRNHAICTIFLLLGPGNVLSSICNFLNLSKGVWGPSTDPLSPTLNLS